MPVSCPKRTTNPLGYWRFGLAPKGLSLYGARSSLSFHSVGKLHLQNVSPHLHLNHPSPRHCWVSSLFHPSSLLECSYFMSINLPHKRAISCYRPLDGSIDHRVFHESSSLLVALPTRGDCLTLLYRHLTSSARQRTLLMRYLSDCNLTRGAGQHVSPMRHISH